MNIPQKYKRQQTATSYVKTVSVMIVATKNKCELQEINSKVKLKGMRTIKHHIEDQLKSRLGVSLARV